MWTEIYHEIGDEAATILNLQMIIDWLTEGSNEPGNNNNLTVIDDDEKNTRIIIPNYFLRNSYRAFLSQFTTNRVWRRAILNRNK